MRPTEIKRSKASLVTAIIVVAAAVVFFLLVYNHTSGVNGPWYWQWPWRRLDGGLLYPLLFVAFIPFLFAQYFYNSKKLKLPPSLLLIMLSTFLMELVVIALQSPSGFDLLEIVRIIESPLATSYFTDAIGVMNLSDFFSLYHENIEHYHLHARNKPPGPVLFYTILLYFSKLPPIAPMVGGILIGLLATLAVPATYLLTKVLSDDREAAFSAASFIAITPGLVLFFPEFDQIFPVLTCLLIGFWALALEKDSFKYSLLFGVVFALSLFITWNVLVLGAFIAAYTLYFIFRSKGQSKERPYSVAIRHSIIVLAVLIIIYLIFWFISGYNPIATFFSSLANQKGMVGEGVRPYPYTVLYDLLDFALGAGWISVVVVVIFFVRKFREKDLSKEFLITVFCLLQLLIVAVGAFLPAETARVWIFMLPLFIFPIGLELSRWGFRSRVAVYVSLWAITAVISQNMGFIYP